MISAERKKRKKHANVRKMLAGEICEIKADAQLFRNSSEKLKLKSHWSSQSGNLSPNLPVH